MARIQSACASAQVNHSREKHESSGKEMAIYHDEERLYSEHRTAAEAELLFRSWASKRAILLYSGS